MRRRFLLSGAALLALPAIAQPGAPRVETVAGGLAHPWGLAFLPDGTALVTERPGRLRRVTPDGEVSDPVRGVPRVFAEEQGGLLDVVLAPDFAESRRVYLSFAEPGEGNTASTAVARGRLNQDGTALEDTEVIFRQQPKLEGGMHFGSRLAFAPDGNLFVTTGERFRFDPAQDVSDHLGTVLRIAADGSVPQDNPFVGRQGARPEIWSYGHRNIQAAAIRPEDGALWIAEMGPRGGDELNRPEAGRNHGWPLVSWGQHYDGRDIPDPPTRPDLAGSIHQWTPVISPSGMVFYQGSAFPDWQGDILIGGLSARGIVRVELDGQRVRGEHRIDLGRRIRDVAVAPDGVIHALTDAEDGALLRLRPAD
ncbi:PQQ-dependent sugar dehydrogenase [Falsiroseomonas selenitidurans]|uniref:PQQ-dependent sugar dehydrogenase n=1 Tax=Falsiroseomonas selenitidurans TaxID=2716335 RepID=A0ABX1DXY9_9PROT|nr:PQQ-dependent sugar dehydrogenase [Falsiroseomonas selenitidurans]NKC29741.1 PQQ-dependent sugar dehydrogenase [Falsiroseomonas selenitidurans]